MAAVLARGTTVIENAAIEPEITALAHFLVSMGAKIDGIGTNRLEIQGVDELHATDVETIPDRIETGTFLVAVAMTGGKADAQACGAGALPRALGETRGCRLPPGVQSIPA